MRQLFGHRDYRKHVILCFPRSGSTMLSRMLLDHPNVKRRGEYFARTRGRSPESMWAKLFVGQRRHVRSVGITVHYNHPVDSDPLALWDFLRSQRDLRVLHLHRRNVLRRYLSTRIAQKRSLYRLEAPAERPPLASRQVAITAQQLRGAIASAERKRRHFTELFAAHEVLEVVYEDLVSEPEVGFARVCDFLEIPRTSAGLTTPVMNPEPLSRLILGYDELKAAFTSSEWAWMFDEEGDGA